MDILLTNGDDDAGGSGGGGNGEKLDNVGLGVANDS
jgi:hypothetical protein